MRQYTVDELNEMDRGAFAGVLGAVFEHSPWVAERAWSSRPFAAKEQLHAAMLAVVEAARPEEQLALIRAHPDLGGRLKMTELSVNEQRGAGLSELSADEYAEFAACNRSYTDKFGFPFIIAVKGKTKELILQAMKTRLALAPEEEQWQALMQIGEITRFRLNDLII